MKKIRILDLAVQDLERGRDFYEIQVWRVLDCRSNPRRTKQALADR